MDKWIGLILLFLSLIFGVFFGYLGSKFFLRREHKKQEKNAKEVLAGKRKNQIEIDGQIYEANKFRIRTDEGREIIIDLKGGGKIENAKENNKKETRREKEEESEMESDHRTSWKNSNSTRGKERTSKRNGFRRIRRFG